jgi:hypothetical protein
MQEVRLEFPILPQPDLTTCGPTSLHGIYNFYGDKIPLAQVIEEAEVLEEGGTLAVLLALHALRRGYRARIYTYNLKVFDPSWFRGKHSIAERLQKQAEIKKSPKLRQATKGYLEFFRLGGELRYEDLTPKLIRSYVAKGTPILTGLSATYLYGDARELPDCTHDDLRGDPSGHFVILCGYSKEQRTVDVADPLTPNAHGTHQHYSVPIERVVGAIFLGIVTYDCNMLIIEPAKG